MRGAPYLRRADPTGSPPQWWPPSDVGHLDEVEREIYGDDLDTRYRLISGVAEAVQADTLDAALDVLRAFCPDPVRDLDDFAYGDLVVPSDRVLQAEALDAGVALCRTLVTGSGMTPGPGSGPTALQSAAETFRRVDGEYRQRGHVEAVANDAVPGSADGRLSRLVRTGVGEEMPSVNRTWDDWLAASAAALFDDGSALGWARYVWTRLSGSGLTIVDTELDRARAQVRLVALSVLRRRLLARIDGSTGDDWPLWAINPGIPAFQLGVLAGIAGVEPGHQVVDSEYSLAEASALVSLVSVEAPNLASALLRELGVSRIFAVTLASRYDGARYPLGPEAMYEIVNANLTPDKHATFEWVDGGMHLS